MAAFTMNGSAIAPRGPITCSITGGAGFDTLYMGPLSQSQFTITGPNASGVTTLSGASGSVYSLTSVEQIVFATGAYSVPAPPPPLALIIPGTGTAGNDTLTGTALADNLRGLAGIDTLNGLAGNDILNGGTGTDTMTGGLGNDTYVVDNTGDIVTENIGEGADLVQSSISYTLPANVENLTLTGVAINATGNASDNVLTGNAAANVLDGGLGNDTLNGGAGADTMTGGLGNDTYIVDNAGDLAIENIGEGTDLVKASINYILPANVENLTLTGVTAINATGNTLDNVLTGNAAANVLDGGLGNDTMIGGAGSDTYVVDSLLDIVTEQPGVGGGIDKVNTLLASYTLGANVENLAYTGALAFTGTGNGLANNITGGIGDDILSGGAGADRLNGGDGNDTLDGGTGADTMAGGMGNDTYVVGSAANLALGIVGDTISELPGAGIDTVQSSISYALGLNLENLTLTGVANINGTGNTLDNILTGNDGNNTLIGGLGSDTLLGGLGDDTLIYDSADTKIDGGLGTDTLKISGAGIMLDLNLLTTGKITGIEKLNLTGSGNNSLLVNQTSLLNLTGPAGHDLYVTGNAGDSVSVATATGAMWTDMGAMGIINVGGVNYHQYTHITGAVTDHLYVQDTLTQTLM